MFLVAQRNRTRGLANPLSRYGSALNRGVDIFANVDVSVGTDNVDV